MARRIEKLPAARGGVKSQMYPWDDWMDGSPWVILYGEDYRCAHNGMVSGIYRAAKERGGVVETRKIVEPDGEQIGWAFQFIELPQPTQLHPRRLAS